MFLKALGIAAGAGALLGLGAWYVESTAQAAQGGGGGAPVPPGGGGGSTFQPTQTTGGGGAPYVTAPNGPTQYTVTTAQTGTDGMLKVRSGPGTNYGQVAMLNHGDTVSASGRTAAGAGSTNGWAEVIVSGAVTGWASTDFLTPTSPDVVPLAQNGMAAVHQRIQAMYGPRGIAAMNRVLRQRYNVVG